MLLSSSTDSWVNFGNEISYDKLNNGIIIQKDNQITKIENFNEKGPIGKIQIQDFYLQYFLQNLH